MTDDRRDKIHLSEKLIHYISKCLHIIVVNADENRPIFAKKLTEKGEPRIHHAEPAVVPVEGFTFLADGFSEPLADDWAIDVVVIGPVFVSRVVGRIDVDALHLTGVVRQDRLEGNEVIPLDDEVPFAGLAAGKLGYIFQQMKRDLPVVVYHRLFAYPVERRHNKAISSASSILKRKCPRGILNKPFLV